MRAEWNKLVRNKIPEHIEKNGETAVTKVLDEETYRSELLKKLNEEAAEVGAASGDPQELAKEIGDVQEVLAYIIREFAVDPAAVTQIQQKRHEERGGFDERIFLEHTE